MQLAQLLIAREQVILLGGGLLEHVHLNLREAAAPRAPTT